ncbi:MAG: ankyrin repeat domain-containing protein [Acidobacteria bacterium]|nr:ankyrin repeat domain-containing protein [Acidobacteriota bacterium]
MNTVLVFFVIVVVPVVAMGQSLADAGATELHWAAHRDDVALVERLIRSGADVNAANEYGVTALTLACTNGSTAVVEKLLAAGANPNVAQVNGVTPLMECARTGSAAAVAALLARGASVDASHARTGQTALMWAAAGRHAEVVTRLIERGAHVRARSNGGFTPLLFAARSGDEPSARLLVDAGADVDEATPEHGSALVVASAGGHEPLARLLLERGANPNAADRYGITPLHNAVRRGLTSLVGMRFDESYRVQPPNMPELAAALVKRGANPNARMTATDTRGPDGTPFEMKGATPYFLAAVAGDGELMRLLGRAGADPRLGVDGGATPLMAAARSACTGSCEFRGANLAVDPAAAAAALEAVEVAVELGADVDAANEDGQTAMHMAAFTGADGVVQLLADRGAAVDVQDTRGETPWSMAAGLSTVLRYRGQYGTHDSTAALLLKLGAKPITQQELEARAAALVGR